MDFHQFLQKAGDMYDVLRLLGLDSCKTARTVLFCGLIGVREQEVF